MGRDQAMAVAMAALGCIALAGCDRSRAPAPGNMRVQGGDPARGRASVETGRYGCTACHTIPGIRGRAGVAGPPLVGMAGRAFIAGQLPNNPDQLVAFLQDPPALIPRTGMPAVGRTAEQARDVPAFLYTLEPAQRP